MFILTEIGDGSYVATVSKQKKPYAFTLQGYKAFDLYETGHDNIETNELKLSTVKHLLEQHPSCIIGSEDAIIQIYLWVYSCN